MTAQSAQPVSLYPLLLHAKLVERPWGGQAMGTLLDKPLPVDRPIGESWEIFPDNVIANGALAGRTVRDIHQIYGDKLSPRDAGEFPLLVKFLDAREWLSVQVHPDDGQAQMLEGWPRGKTECWYIIAAEPGAEIAYGVTRALTAHEFRTELAAGNANDLLSRVPVKAGDFIYVPATTPHAIGPGIVLYELQQFSDTTYRVYDWGRLGLDGKPRELHLDKALSVMDFQPRPVITMLPPEHVDAQGNGITALVRAMYFGLERVHVSAPEARYKLNGVCHLLSVIDGAVRVDDVLIQKGRSALIPAGLNHYTLRPEPTGSAVVTPTMLRAWPVVRED